MAGRDLLGIAQTGTGKTAAFALPILHRLATDRRPAPRRGCRVLVLSPTRELASQIAESFRDLRPRPGLTVARGVRRRPVRRAGAGAGRRRRHPGRHARPADRPPRARRSPTSARSRCSCSTRPTRCSTSASCTPIRSIVATLPKQRQNLFFSATMPTEIGKLAGELLERPGSRSR